MVSLIFKGLRQTTHHQRFVDIFSRDTLIYSEKSCLPKAKPSKINTLDSRLRGNDDLFSVSLVVSLIFKGLRLKALGAAHVELL